MFQGRIFSKSPAEHAGGAFSKRAVKYSYSLTPFCFAVSMSEYIPQELFAPSGLLLNS
jgi:hypothetical protein